MLTEQEKELFCIVHETTIAIYNDCEQAVNKWCEKHLELFPFCDSDRELSIWKEALTEKMAREQALSARRANEMLRLEVLEKLNPEENSFLSITMENQLIRAYLLGRSGK